MTTEHHQCPHCGNRNPDHTEDNGLPPDHLDYTLLCTAWTESPSHEYEQHPDRPELWRCGEQWEPNSPEDTGTYQGI